MTAPYPPLELVVRVRPDVLEFTDPIAAYEQAGAQTKQTLLRLLPDDWSFDGKRVLDFGCGAGRTLRHFLPEAERAEIWGADIDKPSVDWINQNLSPPLQAWRSPSGPPLGLEHGSFDLIYSISVFTHLDVMASLWLLELGRLLKPDGILIATYYGRWNSEYLAGEPWVEDRIGRNVLRHTMPWDHGGPVVLMSDWWVREHWGRAFDILHLEPQVDNMTWAVMRKRNVDLSEDDIDRPSDDPREYVAVKHNLHQVRRELEEQQALYEGMADQVRREHEETLSWRVTRPLRAIGRSRRGRNGG